MDSKAAFAVLIFHGTGVSDIQRGVKDCTKRDSIGLLDRALRKNFVTYRKMKKEDTISELAFCRRVVPPLAML